MNNEKIIERCDAVLQRTVGLLPEAVRQQVLQQMYVAGGAIVSLVLDEEPQDYDLWFDDSSAIEPFKKRLKAKDPLPGCELLVETENGITLKFSTGEVVQLVTRFTGPPSRVFESFDYTHCKAYYRPAHYLGAVQEEVPAELHLNRELIEAKKLHYDGLKDQYALNTLKRMCKFVSRGWTPDNETVMNLYRAIQKSPPIDVPEEHKRQVVGFYGSSFT